MSLDPASSSPYPARNSCQCTWTLQTVSRLLIRERLSNRRCCIPLFSSLLLLVLDCESWCILRHVQASSVWFVHIVVELSLVSFLKGGGRLWSNYTSITSKVSPVMIDDLYGLKSVVCVYCLVQDCMQVQFYHRPHCRLHSSDALVLCIYKQQTRSFQDIKNWKGFIVMLSWEFIGRWLVTEFADSDVNELLQSLQPVLIFPTLLVIYIIWHK